MNRFLSMAGLLLLCSCTDPQATNPIVSRQDAFDMQQAELAMKEHPVGRYQFIKENVGGNGVTTWTCLDTATGEIEFAEFDQAHPDKADFSCAN